MIFLVETMTYRIYARWANQKTSHRTTTDNKAVADAAWNELTSMSWEKGNRPLGLAYNFTGEDNKKVQIDYVDLSDGG